MRFGAYLPITLFMFSMDPKIYILIYICLQLTYLEVISYTLQVHNAKLIIKKNNAKKGKLFLNIKNN